jgi:hypothetical protein
LLMRGRPILCWTSTFTYHIYCSKSFQNISSFANLYKTKPLKSKNTRLTNTFTIKKRSEFTLKCLKLKSLNFPK